MKRLAHVTAALVAALLFSSSMVVQAGPPTEDVSGLWQYQPFVLESREAGCNTFLQTFENGVWTGTFVGTSTEDGKVVIHCSGAWSFHAIVSFDHVTVLGHEGTLAMSVVGKRPDGRSDWEGRWVILDGTNELAALHGQGTWWGPGAPAPEQWGDIYYSGQIHFDPK